MCRQGETAPQEVRAHLDRAEVLHSRMGCSIAPENRLGFVGPGIGIIDDEDELIVDGDWAVGGGRNPKMALVLSRAAVASARRPYPSGRKKGSFRNVLLS